MEAWTHKTYEAGRVIFYEGDRQNCMYIIEQGQVGIYADYGKNTVRELVRLDGRSDRCYFGEMGLMDGEPRSATAVALTQTKLTVIPRAQLGEYFITQPLLIMRIMMHMSGRIRTLTGEYRRACHTADELLALQGTGAPRQPWVQQSVEECRAAADRYATPKKITRR